jgi:hypothetical protein
MKAIANAAGALFTALIGSFIYYTKKIMGTKRNNKFKAKLMLAMDKL